MRGSRRAKILLALGLAAVGLIAAGTIAWASIPDADGVIHGCFKTASGDLRIIDAATESCAGNETAISWNQGLRGWEIKGETTETNSDGVKSVLAHCSRGKDILGAARIRIHTTFRRSRSTQARLRRRVYGSPRGTRCSRPPRSGGWRPG
jgi:hypothetical protein